MKLSSLFPILMSLCTAASAFSQVNIKPENTTEAPKPDSRWLNAKPMPKSAPKAMPHKGAVSTGTSAYTYGFAGCGLGTYLHSPSQQEDQSHQVIASIVNIYSGQSFAISFGTSNCDDRTQSAMRLEREVFVAANLGVLQKETAQGIGPALTAFADLLGCKHDAAVRFSAMSQQNYQKLFAVPEPKQVLQRYLEQVNQSDDLSKVCTRVFI